MTSSVDISLLVFMLLAHSMTSSVDIYLLVLMLLEHTMTSSVDISLLVFMLLTYTMTPRRHIVCTSIYAVSTYYDPKETYCV